MDPRSKRLLPLVVVLALVSACASFGGGRPEVVRAEDVLTNSLTIWGQAMIYHKNHSREESPAVYKVLEGAREGFPPAWEALFAATKSYKRVGGDATTLQKAMAAVEAIIKSLHDTGVV